MYNLYYAMWGLQVATLACMVHAAVYRRWSVVQGAAPLVFTFAVLTVVFGAAK
jgi:hypothetical protein